MLQKYRYEVRTFRGFKGCTDLAVAQLAAVAMVEEIQRECQPSKFWWSCVIDLETGLKKIITSEYLGQSHISHWVMC